MAKKTLLVQGLTITIEQVKEADYISLTDIAKHSNGEPRFVIQNWLKNSNTISYLWEWEVLHNPALNRVQMHTVLESTASNRFIFAAEGAAPPCTGCEAKWRARSALSRDGQAMGRLD